MEQAMDGGRGVILISGHFSNWELTAYAYSRIFRMMNIIAKVQASRGLNQKINRYRELAGNKIIDIGASLRTIPAKLKDNRIVSFLIDQSAHPDYSVYIDFFGKKAATFAGPARYALKYNVPVVLGYGIRNDDFTYDIYFEPVKYDDMNGYTEENIIELTQRMQKALENVIRENPSQWLWFHKRFKHVKQ
jgi:KDO2-lipid IV(A) lauroyltransferase